MVILIIDRHENEFTIYSELYETAVAPNLTELYKILFYLKTQASDYKIIMRDDHLDEMLKKVFKKLKYNFATVTESVFATVLSLL
jgi:hypothetical protein